MSSQRIPSWVRPALTVLVVGVMAFAVLALGAVHVWTRLAVTLAVAILLALTFYERRARTRPLRLAAPLLPLAVAVVATALQLIPLPSSVLSAVSPTTHDVLSKTLANFTWHPLSLDWPGTLSELAKLLLYFGFLVAALQYASRSERRHRLAQAIVAIATLASLVGFAQALVDSERVLFFYTPSALAPTLARGTLINPNHFGALLCLALPCGLALAMSEHRHRVAVIFAMCTMNIALVLTLSRGAIVAGAFGQVLAFVLLRRRKATGQNPRGARVALAIAFAGSVVAAGIGFATFVPEVAETVADDSFTTGEKKLQAWEQATTLVGEYPVTGVGRGAFEQAFARVSKFGDSVRFPWVENGYFQAAIDWGIPIASLLFGLALWVAVLAFRRLGRDPIKIAALAGLVALAAHELVDFSIEVPGVALCAMACIALVFGGKSKAPAGSTRRVSRLAFAVPVALVAVFAFSMATPLAGQTAASLRAVTRDPAVPIDVVLQRGTAATARHPADYFVHLLVAERLARERHPQTMRWLGRAIFLNPTYAPAHLMAAELLASSGRKAQALIEYRLAAANTWLPRHVWDKTSRHYPALGDLLKAAPSNVNKLVLLAKWLGRNRRADDSFEVYAKIVQQQPDHVVARRHLVMAALRQRNLALARQRLTALMRLDQSEKTWAVQARERLMAGDPDTAMKVIDLRLTENSEKFTLELALASLLSARKRYAEARDRLGRLQHHTNVTRDQLAKIHEVRAKLEKRAGNTYQQLWELEQAQRLRMRE